MSHTLLHDWLGHLAQALLQDHHMYKLHVLLMLLMLLLQVLVVLMCSCLQAPLMHPVPEPPQGVPQGFEGVMPPGQNVNFTCNGIQCLRHLYG
jgi:hypothetical protein